MLDKPFNTSGIGRRLMRNIFVVLYFNNGIFEDSLSNYLSLIWFLPNKTAVLFSENNISTTGNRQDYKQRKVSKYYEVSLALFTVRSKNFPKPDPCVRLVSVEEERGLFHYHWQFLLTSLSTKTMLVTTTIPLISPSIGLWILSGRGLQDHQGCRVFLDGPVLKSDKSVGSLGNCQDIINKCKSVGSL